MSTSIDPLRTTPLDLHRFWFSVSDRETWYAIIKECNQWFGKDWKCQRKILRKLSSKHSKLRLKPIEVWFDVPDIRFAVWVSVKYSVQVQQDVKLQPGK
jgi:uncharacterized protein (DUF924 family)